MKNKVILFLFLLLLLITINNYSFAYDVDVNVYFDDKVLNFTSTDYNGDVSAFNNVIITQGPYQYSVRCYDSTDLRLVQAIDNSEMFYIVGDFQYNCLVCTTSTSSTNNLTLTIRSSTYNSNYDGYVMTDFPIWNISTITNYSGFNLNNNYGLTFNSDFEITGDILYPYYSTGNGLELFVNDLISVVNVSSLFDIVGYAIPIIVLSVLFVFSYYLVKKLLYRIKK